MKPLMILCAVSWLVCGGLLARAAFTDTKPDPVLLVAAALLCVERSLHWIEKSVGDE